MKLVDEIPLPPHQTGPVYKPNLPSNPPSNPPSNLPGAAMALQVVRRGLRRRSF